MGNAWRSPLKSDHFNGREFVNLEDTPNFGPDSNLFKAMRDFMKRSDACKPSGPLPAVRQNLSQLNPPSPAITWFGHSSYLLSSQGRHILVDPVLSGRASPVPGMVKAFVHSDVYTADDMPDLDLLVLTHNHYDHLDYSTVAKLLPRCKAVLFPMGVGRSLPSIPAGVRIIEMDWFEKATLWPEAEVEMRPARHFSGRGLQRNRSLWASLVLNWDGRRIFLGGDSGYDAQFVKTGKECGPFDLAILECGQYNKNWPFIHMFPEQTVQAAKDLRASVLMPVHWGKFMLAGHDWNEPPRRALAAAEKTGLAVATPMIGETWIIGSELPVKQWWNNI